MATDKNFVIKNGLTINGSEIITSAGNLTNVGTLIVGTGTQGVAGDADITVREGNAFAGIDLRSTRTTGNIGGIRSYNSSNVGVGELLFEVQGRLNYTGSLGFALGGISVIDGSRNITAGTIDSGAISASGSHIFTANDVDFIVRDTTDSITNYIWRDYSDSKLYLGTPTAVATIRSTLDLNSNNITNAGTISSGAIDSSGTSNFDSIQLTDASKLGFGTVKAASGISHTASTNEGIFWNTNDAYGIFRTAGAWSSPNFQQLKLIWATGIEIDGNGTQYGKSGINFLNGNIKMDGTQILDASRNLSNIGTISSGGITATANSNAILMQTSSNPSSYYAYISANYNYAQAFSIKAKGAGNEYTLMDWGDGVGLEFHGGSTSNIKFSNHNLSSIGTISSGAITSSDYFRVYDSGTQAFGFFKEKTILGTGTSNDLCLFAESITDGGEIHFMTGGSGTKRLTINSSGNIGINNTNPQTKLHIETNNVGIPTTYGGVVFEATDAQIDIISDASGTWGSAINLVEGASTSANTDVWSIARKTTGGNGDSSLNFNFGPANQHDNTNRVAFSSGGNITLTGTVDGVDIAARDAVLTSTTTTANAALPKAGGTMSGHIYMANYNIYDINTLSFNDPGPDEGISWDGGNIAIYESPDDLTTNTAGNLQFVYGGTRRLTVNSTGIDVNGTLTSTAVGSGWTDHVNLFSSDGTNRWNVLVDNGAGDVLRFGYNSTKRVDISTGGNVDTTGFFEADQGFRQAIAGNDGLRVYGENANQPLIRVSANAIGNNSADYGFTLAYRGDRSGNENSLAIYSDNQTGTQVEAINIKQDGTTHFGADVYLKSSGRLFFNATSNFGIGAGGHNYNSGYFDTVESGASTDPLELVYYQGRGVNIGSGASKNLGCAGLGVGVADNGIRSGYMAHFKSTGDVALLLEADSDNVTETDNPFIRFEQDASLVAARIGYINGTNDFEIFNEYGSPIYFGTNNGNRAVLGTTGDWTVTGNVTAYGSVSDIRRKENVEIIPNAIDKVKTLDGITFNFKDKPEERMTGVIAQQVMEVLPEAVYEHETIEGEETLAVHYGNMVGLLIEGMKEQQKQIEELKEEVSSLRSKI